MHLPVKQPELLLKCDEYVETWESLIQTFYLRIISDDAVYTALQLDEERQTRFSMELGTVLLVTAMRAWNQKKLSEPIKKRIEDGVIRSVFTNIFSAEGDALETCLAFYAARYELFQELSPTGANTKKEAESHANKLRDQSIGFARYIVGQCSDVEENENTEIIKKLSIHLIGAAGTFLRLTGNTTLDSNSLIGMKPRFIVTK